MRNISVILLIVLSPVFFFSCEDEKAESPKGTLGITIDVWYQREIFVSNYEIYIDDALKIEGIIDWYSLNIENIELSPAVCKVEVVLLDDWNVWVYGATQSVTIQKDEVASITFDSFYEINEPTPTFEEDFSTGGNPWHFYIGNWRYDGGVLAIDGPDDNSIHIAGLTNSLNTSTVSFQSPFAMKTDINISSGSEPVGIGITTKDTNKTYYYFISENNYGNIEHYILEYDWNQQIWTTLDHVTNAASSTYALELRYYDGRIVCRCNDWEQLNISIPSNTFDQLFLYHQGTTYTTFDDIKFYGDLNGGTLSKMSLSKDTKTSLLCGSPHPQKVPPGLFLNRKNRI